VLDHNSNILSFFGLVDSNIFGKQQVIEIEHVAVFAMVLDNWLDSVSVAMEY